MRVYERLGVRPIINVVGPATNLGGALVEPEIADAMAEASRQSVRLDELQAAASNIIANMDNLMPIAVSPDENI